MSAIPSGKNGKEPPADVETDERHGMVISERYRIGALLGTGGMGRVYAAEHVLMRKKLAVKVLHKELSLVPEVVTRFKREAMAAANIDHPNVAAATDFGKLDDGSVFLVLEYIHGLALRESINAGPIPEARSIHIARQVASALASAHALDIVHRDLKPENVMLVRKAGDPDFVKVLDFGIAKVPIQELSDRGSLRPGQAITKIGMVFGTPEYMAPEQALGQPVDARADLYSLGVILFEMLAGVRPYASSSQVGILGQQLSTPVPRVGERAPGVQISSALDDLLQQLLDKEADERPESAKDIVVRLDDILRDVQREGREKPAQSAAAAALRRLAPSGLARGKGPLAAARGGPAVPPLPAAPPRPMVPPPPSKRPPPPRSADEPLAAPPLPPKLSPGAEEPGLLVDSPIITEEDEFDEPETIELPASGAVDAGSVLESVSRTTDGTANVQQREASSVEGASGPSDAAVPLPMPDEQAGYGAAPLVVQAPPERPSGARALWERGVAWVEAGRGRWPRSVQSALVGVPSSAVTAGGAAAVLLGVGGLLAVASLGFGSDAADEGAGYHVSSTSTPSSSVASTQLEPAGHQGGPEGRPHQAPEQELEAAKKKGAAALEPLAKRYDRDPTVHLELAKAYRLEKRYGEVVGRIGHVVELEPQMRRDAEVATLLWQSAQMPESQEAAFALLEGPMASRGADILFDLSTTRGIRADVKARAERYFQSESFAKVASDALKVAVALRNADTCAAKKALLPRAERHGDRRALKVLRTMEATTGCGRRAKADCYPCLREGSALAKAIDAIDARTRQ